MKGISRRIKNWWKLDKAESVTAAFVALATLLALMPSAFWIINLLEISTTENAFLKKQLGFISLCGAAGIISWLIGSAVGSQFGSLCFKVRIKHAVEANRVKKDFNLKTSRELLSFIRVHGLKVYRAKRPLEDYEADIECRMEPLFSLYGYNPYVRAHYLSENMLCFEKEAIDQIYQKVFVILHQSKPDLIESATDANASEAINKLKLELEAKKKELQDKSLVQGPEGREQSRRPFVAIHAYAAMCVLVKLIADWGKREDRKYSVEEINSKYREVLADDQELGEMIAKWKDPNDSSDEKFSDTMNKFLRLALTSDKANLAKGSETISQVMEQIEKERERKRK